MYICVCDIQHQIIEFDIKFGKSVRSIFVGLQGLPAARGWEAPWAAHAPGVALRHPGLTPRVAVGHETPGCCAVMGLSRPRLMTRG